MAEVKKAGGKTSAPKKKVEVRTEAVKPKSEPKPKVVNPCDDCRFTYGFSTCKTCVNYKE